ncbi:MAG: DUF1929 domain-containing protein [Polyangiaceae bacterium]|nr:DUF1929 domain-containing protein [Polyangiaceae bacterium]
MSGTWTVLPNHSQTFAIHAALIKPGKILYFAGDEYDTTNRDRGDFDHASVFDTTTYEITAVRAPTTDVFCSGHAKLEDGRVLVGGGASSWDPKGLAQSWVFDPSASNDGPTGAWTQVASMLDLGPHIGAGRWYPTLLTLSDGRVLAACGVTTTGAQNRWLEVFSPYPTPSGTWSPLGALFIVPANAPAYPRMFLLPNGHVFCSSGMNGASRAILDTGTGLVVDVVPAPGLYAANGANQVDNWRRSAVLLPLVPNATGGYTTSVLVCDDAASFTIDLTNGVTADDWVETGPRKVTSVRLHSEALLLPDGKVFVCCGVAPSSGGSYDCVMTPELYDPGARTWSTLQNATVARGYHSVSMLMPDGRVWTAGSSTLTSVGPDGGPSEPPKYRKELRIEIFAPDYVTDPKRPVLTYAPGNFLLGETFQVKTPDAASITKVRILRAGSTTHGFNADQRCVELKVTAVDSTTLNVEAPLKAEVAPPGDYLLFLIDNENRPSIGQFILCIADRPVTVRNSKLLRKGRLGAAVQEDWEEGGDAYTVTAMCTHQGALLVTAGTNLWRRGRMGPGTQNDWLNYGEAHGVIAMASHLGDLYVVATDNKLWKRGAIGPGTGNAWSLVGDAFNVQAMTSHQGKLLVVSDGKLWRRNALTPNSGNDWIEDGAVVSGSPVPNIVGLASAGGSLFALFNSHLWRRVNIDPTTANASWTDPVWVDMGQASDCSGLTFYKTLWG